MLLQEKKMPRKEIIPTRDPLDQNNPAKNKAAFLAQISKVGTIKKAAAAAGVSRWVHYQWLSSDPEYVENFKEAKEDFKEAIEGKIYDAVLKASRRDILLHPVAPLAAAGRLEPMWKTNPQTAIQFNINNQQIPLADIEAVARTLDELEAKEKDDK